MVLNFKNRKIRSQINLIENIDHYDHNNIKKRKLLIPILN